MVLRVYPPFDIPITVLERNGAYTVASSTRKNGKDVLLWTTSSSL